MRAVSAAVTILLLVALAWFGYWLRPERISFSPVALVPVWSVTGQGQEISIPKDFLAAEIFRSGDEFSAYLMYDYLRSLSEIGRHTSELQSPYDLVCRLLLEKKKKKIYNKVIKPIMMIK